MSEPVTLARPYAKAAFEFALNARSLDGWTVFLEGATRAVFDTRFRAWLSDPAKTHQDRLNGFKKVLGAEQVKGGLQNFIELLAKKDRIFLLPEIYALFKQLREAHEKACSVTVRSAFEMDEAQINQLLKILQKKLDKQIQITLETDPQLIGGIVIQAADLVMDYSIKGKINKLTNVLVG